MNNSILVSIKPIYKDLLFTQEKVFEYRNVIPKKKIKYMYVYETSPVKQISYVLELDTPIIYPEQIKSKSYGVERFNNGLMNCKIAYPIKHIYLIESIQLSDLKLNFNFIVPQSFIYLDSNPLLKNHLNSLELNLLW